MRCGVCGGGYSIISATHVGCSTARNKSTCNNRLAIKRTELEERALGSLKGKLMDPTLFEEFCEEFTREMNRLRMEGGASLTAARAEVKRIDRELDRLLDLILKGGHAERINAKMVELEARKADLERALAQAKEPPPLLHPEMATFYREQVAALHVALGEDDGEGRAAAAELLRTLVDKIVLTPVDGRLEINVHGDLASILAIAHEKSSRTENDDASQAPAREKRSRFNVHKSKGRPLSGAAYVAELAKQVKLVAGARFDLKLRDLVPGGGLSVASHCGLFRTAA